jgi:hypothetical protein
MHGAEMRSPEGRACGIISPRTGDLLRECSQEIARITAVKQGIMKLSNASQQIKEGHTCMSLVPRMPLAQ